MFALPKIGRAPSRRRRTIVLAASAAVALAMFAIACGESPNAPLRSPVASTSVRNATSSMNATTSTKVPTLVWTKEVSQATASRVIGPRGGSLSIPNGIRVIVPRGAVESPVRFSVTRLPGNIVAYDFQPHGITFAVPVELQQPTLGTSLFKLPPVTAIQGAYFLDASLLDQDSGTASVAEFEPTFVSADRAWVTFTVKHFSGYLVSIGRR